VKIYTKTGDDGTTGLFNGQRVSKSSQRVDTYGTVDELNSIIGIVISYELPLKLKSDLQEISRNLYILGSDLATPFDSNIKIEAARIDEEKIKWLEQLIDNYTNELPPLNHFILPGGTLPAATLHHARTVCRRAERLAVELSKSEDIGEIPLQFLNRLSDYLFTAARYVNHLLGVDEVLWQKGNE
jgi:cob(I)alamin adenosyltransferase